MPGRSKRSGFCDDEVPWKKAVGPQAEIFRQGQSPCPTVSPFVKNFGFATSPIRGRLERADHIRPYGGEEKGKAYHLQFYIDFTFL